MMNNLKLLTQLSRIFEIKSYVVTLHNIFILYSKKCSFSRNQTKYFSSSVIDPAFENLETKIILTELPILVRE